MQEKNLPVLSELKGMTIHELRIWLKKLGGTPSNKPSAVLVEEITGILDGKQPVRKSNRGRKPKYILQESAAGEKKRISVFSRFKRCEDLPKEFFGGRKAPVSAHGVTAPFKVLVASDDGAVSSNVIADGVLVAEFERPYIINYDAHTRYPVFFLKNGLVEFYKLKTGDYLTGHAIETAGKYLTVEIDKINGRDREEWERGGEFDDIPSLYPDERYCLGGGNRCRAIDLFCPVGKGARVVVRGGSKSKIRKVIESLCGELQNQSKLIIMPVCAMPEDVGEYAEQFLNAEVVASDFGTDVVEALSRIYVYFERAKRLVEQGDDVVVVVDSLQKLFNLFKSAYINEKTENALNEVRKMLACAKKASGGGSFTLITALPDDADVELVSAVGELFNCDIKVSLDGAFRSFGGVDFCASRTRRMDKCCGEAHCDAVEKLREFVIEKGEPEIISEIFKIAPDNDEIVENADNFIKALRS